MSNLKLNLAVAIACLALLGHRMNVVGPTEAIAEALGISNLPAYVRWRDAYRPLHPVLFAARALDLHDLLEPALAHALEQPVATQRHRALRALVTDQGFGVYSLPVLRRSFCRMLAEEITYFTHSDHVSKAPTSMHDYGVVLGSGGLEGLEHLMDVIRDAVLTPLTEALYEEAVGAAGEDGASTSAAAAAERAYSRLREHAGGRPTASRSVQFSNHHAFVVRYNASEMAGLDMHHDASDVTLNVCLEQRQPSVTKVIAQSGSQSELRFCGFVGDAEHRKRSVTLLHAEGIGIVHLGTHRHGVRHTCSRTRQSRAGRIVACTTSSAADVSCSRSARDCAGDGRDGRGCASPKLDLVGPNEP